MKVVEDCETYESMWESRKSEVICDIQSIDGLVAMGYSTSDAH